MDVLQIMMRVFSEIRFCINVPIFYKYMITHHFPISILLCFTCYWPFCLFAIILFVCFVWYWQTSCNIKLQDLPPLAFIYPSLYTESETVELKFGRERIVHQNKSRSSLNSKILRDPVPLKIKMFTMPHLLLGS